MIWGRLQLGRGTPRTHGGKNFREIFVPARI
nr:MAG TPA: hypothetical protein [Caudoviricetes sp.]